MYNAFWRHALFVRGWSFSVKTFDRSANGCQVIGEGAETIFGGLLFPWATSPLACLLLAARFFSCPLLPTACYAGYQVQNFFLFIVVIVISILLKTAFSQLSIHSQLLGKMFKTRKKPLLR